MIGKVAPRGERIGGLIAYLFGPGRAEEHIDPHVVTSWVGSDLDNDLDQLRAMMRIPLAYAASVPEKHVWHCSMRVAPEDRALSDDEWADIARDLARRVGLDAGDGTAACPWVAVRHADHHIHIAAVLVREDGTREDLRGDYRKVRDACLDAERRYGLRSTAPAHSRNHLPATRGEVEKANRAERHATPRDALRDELRIAAAAAISDHGFVEHLDNAGVVVDLRYSTINDGQITGYSVGWPGDRTADGTQIMYGGSKLAKDLSWPQLQQRWSIVPPGGDPWHAVMKAADTARSELDHGGDPESIADSVADLLDAAAYVHAGRRHSPWRQAATCLQGTRQRPHHRSSPATHALWAAAGALARTRRPRDGDVLLAALRLAALLLELAEKRRVDTTATREAAAALEPTHRRLSIAPPAQQRSANLPSLDPTGPASRRA